MKIIDQPRIGTAGAQLVHVLQNNPDRFDTFYVIVAYVKEGGVLQLQHAIEAFRAGGGRVKVTVGIDENTSIQGLQALMPLCDEIHVYYNRDPGSTFHPKAYGFEKQGDKARLFVGSSNLTVGGLYTNYEAVGYDDYDLTDNRQVIDFSAFRSMFAFYSTPSEFCKVLTPQLLPDLTPLLNDERRERARPSGAHSRRGRASALFGRRRFTAPRVPRRPASRPAMGRGPLKWSKSNLPASDAQRPSRLNTNPTGALRLSQGNRQINQTSYFRNNLFGRFTWRQVRSQPFEEITEVLFDVTILGNNVGQHRLTVRHTPSGEAGQGNVTTTLSWGPLTAVVRNSNVIGRTLSLYAPPRGRTEPFYIEIS